MHMLQASRTYAPAARAAQLLSVPLYSYLAQLHFV